MTTPYISNTFANTYNDDYADSNGFYRILFNGGRAVQARELTQLQTITQTEMGRIAGNLFKEGASVTPGGITVNNKYEFIKLNATASLPSDTSVLVGTTFTGQTSGVKVKILEVIDTEGSDPPTFFVSYTDTSSATAGATPIRMTAGETIDNGTYSYAVQSTNTTSNPAVGRGTRASVAKGEFFTQGRVVFAPGQSLVISKYSSTPTKDVGFLVVQDIVTASDDTSLYDNQGATPNLSAPGADRYRIRLTLTTRDQVDSDQNFVYIARVENGQIVDIVEPTDDYNRINDLLALRTKEESGNYNVKPFKIKFEVNDSDDTVLDLNISNGVSYVNGYRAAKDYPTVIQVAKAQDTVTLNNEVVAASYGNFVRTDHCIGIRNVDGFESVNLYDSTGALGNVIGSAHIRAVERDPQFGCLIQYLFDIQMNTGASFRNVRSFGNGTTDYSDIRLENGQAVLENTGDNNLLFTLPTSRPASLSDISLTVQRKFNTTTDSSGNASLTLTATGETFSNTSSWILANADSTPFFTASITGAGTQSATITGAPSNSSNLEIVAYVNKGAGASRTKTLNETTVTGTVQTDSDGTKYVSLGVADIYDVTRIRAVDSDGADLTSRFRVDNGQRDNFYDIGKVVLRGGQSAPAGNVFVRFKYFSHGTSGDFFSVNSYAGQVDYKNIPNHRLNNGEVVELRDVLDFRPVVNASGLYSSGAGRINELPANTDLITADVVYYQPKYAKLIVTTNGDLEVVEGPSSLTPIVPPTPENSLELYTIKFNPYTLNDSDLVVNKIENRRYTMADIARLEARVDHLEEVTALSLLELDTVNFDVLDSTGSNRTKSGFLVDNFKDHYFSDISSVEYHASIDISDKIMRPSFAANNIRLIYDSDLSTNTILKGDNVYLKHTHTALIDQPYATTTENVNPFAVITHRGNLTISPSSDNWAEQNRIPARVIDGQNAIAAELDFNWNNWMWNWAGRNLNNVNDPNVTINTTTSVTRTSSSVVTTTSSTIREIIGSRVVDVALVPFMRSIKTYFKAEGLKPNSQMFAFFDGTNVANWVREEPYMSFANDSAEYGNTQNTATQHPDTPSVLYTDAEGKVEGSFFIPNNDTIKFRSGTREFKLLDISANNEADATAIAATQFVSQGVIETVQDTIASTRIVSRTVRRIVGGDGTGRNEQDPLAQSFFVNSNSGVFITKVDLYFATKDDTIPVQVQIRSMDNGSPSTQIVPGSAKFISPSSVNTSSDATSATTVEFDEPIYLSPFTEYAIVILAESTAYNVFVAESGEFILGSTEKRVTQQPTLGSLFKSQNGSTWTPDQMKDLMFTLYRANFTSTSGSIILENANVPNRLLDTNPFLTDSGSNIVTVYHPNHGMFVGDNVTITLDSAEVVGGINGSSIAGTRAITAIDQTGYTVIADSSATATEWAGGSAATATQNIMFDLFVPSIQTLVPNNTTASYAHKLTTGKSYAGAETAYQKASSYSDAYLNENNVMSAPRLIANNALEASELGAGVKSATVKVNLGTTSSTVSPVVDLQRTSMFLINNIVDNQDSAATSGFNVPLSFVAETDPTGGSSVAKHITKPVTLASTAVGLKVLIGANRPSVASFDVYYRTGTDETVLTTQNWVKATIDTAVPSDENSSVFRQYEYLIGGQAGNLSPFTKFQVKIVMNSTNSSKVPVIRDLRVIALGV